VWSWSYLSELDGWAWPRSLAHACLLHRWAVLAVISPFFLACWRYLFFRHSSCGVVMHGLEEVGAPSISQGHPFSRPATPQTSFPPFRAPASGPQLCYSDTLGRPITLASTTWICLSAPFPIVLGVRDIGGSVGNIASLQSQGLGARPHLDHRVDKSPLQFYSRNRGGPARALLVRACRTRRPPSCAATVGFWPDLLRAGLAPLLKDRNYLVFVLCSSSSASRCGYYNHGRNFVDSWDFPLSPTRR